MYESCYILTNIDVDKISLNTYMCDSISNTISSYNHKHMFLTYRKSRHNTFNTMILRFITRFIKKTYFSFSISISNTSMFCCYLFLLYFVFKIILRLVYSFYLFRICIIKIYCCCGNCNMHISYSA